MRPLNQLIGHARTKATLEKVLLSQRSMPAWIFGGPLGVGKLTAARLLAGLLVDPETRAEDIRAFMPRIDSTSGALLEAETHPDIHIIRKELALESPIQSIRERKQRTIPVAVLRQQMIGGVVEGHAFDGPAYVKPYCGHAKVFIIDEAELMDSRAQSLLLKTLEEPPANTWFILVTTRPFALDETIRSRCQHASFGLLEPDEMQAWSDVAKLEGDPEEIAWALRFAAGAPGLVVAALHEGLHGWHAQLAPMLEQVMQGGYPGQMAAQMAELLDDSATAAEKADALTSKEAAGRKAMRLLVALIGSVFQERMQECLDDPIESERYIRAIEVLAEAEARVDANVNRKLALAGLVGSLTRNFQSAGAPH